MAINLSTIYQINKRGLYLGISACKWARVMLYVFFPLATHIFFFYHLLYVSYRCLTLTEAGYLSTSSNFLAFGFVTLCALVC